MQVKGVVDRIEEGVAVVLVKGGEILMPAGLIEGINEGSVLNFTIETDIDEESRRREKATELQRRLRKK